MRVETSFVRNLGGPMSPAAAYLQIGRHPALEAQL